MNENKNPVEGGGEGPSREKSVDGIPPLGRSHQGGEGRGGGVDDDFSGVEISITGGVEQMVRGRNLASFFFFFFFFFFF